MDTFAAERCRALPTTRNTVRLASTVRLSVWWTLSLIIWAVRLGFLPRTLADPVEDDDCVVDGIAHKRQERAATEARSILKSSSRNATPKRVPAR